jgi:glycosyltransferase involved in cell wall biosynthesis
VDVTVITVNFKTPKLIEECISSFKLIYPDLRYIVIDNGGCDESLEILEAIESIELIENFENIGHGPALHQGILLSTTKYVFTLDSDTEVFWGGFIELMLEMFESDPALFATGWLRHVNASGVAGKSGYPYIHPCASLVDREKYLAVPPYTHAGAPAVQTMIEAIMEGYHLRDFPVFEYIDHKVAGTRGMFGGRWHVCTDAEPGEYEWKPI